VVMPLKILPWKTVIKEVKGIRPLKN